jgi:hypothetical protein
MISVLRDTFLYASSVDSRGLDETMEILGEVVLRPLFTKEELNTCQMIIRCPHQSVSSLYRFIALQLCSL